jgi:hypothetical protein
MGLARLLSPGAAWRCWLRRCPSELNDPGRQVFRCDEPKGRNRIDGRPRSVGHGQGGDGEQEFARLRFSARRSKSFQIATVQNVNARCDQHRLMDGMSHSFDL